MLQVDFSPFPVLTTARLQLRALMPHDAPAVYALRSDPRAMAYIGKPLLTTLDQAVALMEGMRKALEAREGITWAIALVGDPGTVIGTIGFWRILKEHHRAELGYMLLPEHWHKGYMHEAFGAVLDHGFRTMRLHSVEAVVNPGNEGSIAVLERNGFVIEAYFKENFHFNGEFQDSAVYSLLCPREEGGSQAPIDLAGAPGMGLEP